MSPARLAIPVYENLCSLKRAFNSTDFHLRKLTSAGLSAADIAATEDVVALIARHRETFSLRGWLLSIPLWI
jgi:hypothetical protein